MTARELLSQLHEKGIEIKVGALGRLVIDAPKGTVTPELRGALTELKTELLKILSTPPGKLSSAEVTASPSSPVETQVEDRRVPVLANKPVEKLATSDSDEIQLLERELMRLRTEEEARRAEVEASRLAAEHALRQEQDRWRQAGQEAARRRAEQERLWIEAEAGERAAEETRRHIAEEELARAEEDLRRVRAMEESRRAEIEAQFRAAEDAHLAELEAIRKAENDQALLRAEEERRYLDSQARKRAQEEELRRRAQLAMATVEQEILRGRARADARLKVAEDARRLAGESSRRRADEEARRQAELQMRRRVEEEQQLRAQIEAQMRAEADAKRRTEEEARKREEEAARRRAKEEAERLAAEEVRRYAEAEARLKAEADARHEAAEEARRRAEDEMRRQADEDARMQAEEQARLRAENETRQRAELEARIRAEVEAKLRAEEEERHVSEHDHHTLLTTAESELGTSAWFAAAEEAEFQPVSIPDAVFDGQVNSDAINALHSASVAERTAAIADLARAGGEESFDLISSAFDDPSVEVRSAAARALFNFQEDRPAAFTRALRDATPERRRRIGSAIASSGLVNEAIGNLASGSRDKTYDAFSLLFLMSKAGEVQPLMRAIEEHPNTEVRVAVVKLLALSGQAEVVPAFRRMAVRGSLPPEVRSAVMEAIYQISGQNAGTQPSA